MDDLPFVRRLLRAVLKEQANCDERMVVGTPATLEGFREEVGYRRGLMHAREHVLGLLTEDERREIAGK